MKRKSWPILVLAILAVSLIGVAGMADGNRWVSANGKDHDLKGQNVMFFGEGEAEEFNLSDLADGETRTFGTGERTMTATRSGDVVTLSRPADDDARELDVTCNVNGDECSVLTFDDSDKVMVKIAKTRVCVDGEGDCGDIDVHAIHAGHGAAGNVMVRKIVTCEGEDDEDCADIDVHAFHGDNTSALARIELLADGGEGENMVFVHGGAGDALVEILGDHITLRCPEGDSSIRVDSDEADDTFLCPKHSTPMERSKLHPGHVIIERKSE